MDQSNNSNIQDDQVKIGDAQPTSLTSVPVGGVEAMPQTIEPSSSVEAAAESSESAQNIEALKFGERAKESNIEPSIAPQPNQQIPATQFPKKEEPKVFPQVYGYKIPDKMQQNLSSVKARAGKGKPSSGMTWLNVFIDRLLKMQSN